MTQKHKLKSKLVLVPVAVLISLLSFVVGTKYENQIKDILSSPQTTQTEVQLPKRAKVKRVIDGDTVELAGGTILRYAGITAPETGEPFEEESTAENKRLVEGKTIELARKGLAKVVIYQKRKPLIYEKESLQAQDEAKQKKLGIWNQ